MLMFLLCLCWEGELWGGVVGGDGLVGVCVRGWRDCCGEFGWEWFGNFLVVFIFLVLKIFVWVVRILFLLCLWLILLWLFEVVVEWLWILWFDEYEYLDEVVDEVVEGWW